MRVTELAARIDAALKAGLPQRVRVIGEVSGFRERTHWYFDLKDEGAVINAVVFASTARRQGFVPEAGREVVATGRCDFYAPQGRVSLIVDKLEPVGAGALELRLRALIEELRGLGYFDESRKKTPAAFPRRVAVVTSRSGAALQDVIDTARRRCAAVDLVVVDARMQGDAAAGEVALAIAALNRRRAELGVDAIIVTRGGGSMEDLWAFNERAVADAIHASELPVVAAIGHETDTTVAELVADLRCATPTQAAMRVVPDGAALGEQVDALARRLRDRLAAELRHERERLRALASRPVLTDPRAIVGVQRDRIDAVGRRAGHAAHRSLARARRRLDELAVRLERHRPAVAQARREERLAAVGARLRAAIRGAVRSEVGVIDGLERELHAVGPMQVLARGFSVTLDGRGRVVRSVGAVGSGDRVRTRLRDGSFGSVVEGGADRRAGEAPAPVRRKSVRRRADRDQMDLFGGGA